MFGLFRLIAALLVLITHIGGVPFVAGAAVWGFFMLSALSLWMGNDPERALLVNAALKFPGTAGEWAANLLIVGQTTFGIGRTDASLSPSSWAVDVEILMYFCSCLFLARSARIAVGCLLMLLLAFPVLWWLARGMVQAGDLSLASQLLYSFLPAALLPYSIGTLMWFKREHLKSIGPAWLVAGVVGVLACTIFIHPRSVTLAYILVLPCLIAILGALMYWPMDGRLRKIDTFAGHMSYPLYLLQWTSAYAVVLVIPSEWSWIAIEDKHYAYSQEAFMSVMALALIVSALAAWLIEGPLEQKRHAWLKRTIEVR